MIELLPFLVTAFANHRRETSRKTAGSLADNQATPPHRDIGPLGTAARLVVGFLLVGLIVYGQLPSSGHLTPITWVLGLLGFPLLLLACHFCPLPPNPARFSATVARTPVPSS